MWAGTGKRVRRVEVLFFEPFLTPPAVHVGCAMWDISNATTMRVDLAVEDITTTAFVAVFQTWGDTKVARMRTSWMAIGEVETTKSGTFKGPDNRPRRSGPRFYS
ncbi:MAG: H-type lectin domain-containing protein [Paracoccaceae bacterium]